MLFQMSSLDYDDTLQTSPNIYKEQHILSNFERISFLTTLMVFKCIELHSYHYEGDLRDEPGSF